jgi:hypothetical protein
MITRTALRGLLACALLSGAGAPAAAEAPARAAAPEQSAVPDESQDWASWIQRLEESAQKLRDLRRIERQLQGEVDEAKIRRYPRGEDKARLLAALERAQKDRAEAEEQHPELLEQARQAGVPQGLLQDYEVLTETPAAAE